MTITVEISVLEIAPRDLTVGGRLRLVDVAAPKVVDDLVGSIDKLDEPDRIAGSCSSSNAWKTPRAP